MVASIIIAVDCAMFSSADVHCEIYFAEKYDYKYKYYKYHSLTHKLHGLNARWCQLLGALVSSKLLGSSSPSTV